MSQGIKKWVCLFLILAALLSVIAYFLVRKPDLSQAGRAHQKIAKALHYVESSLTDPLSLIETYPYQLTSFSFAPNYSRESLSETMGLWLETLEKLKEKEKFLAAVETLKKSFLLPNGTLSWRLAIDGEKVTQDPYSATIDDLRVIGVLLKTYKQWNEPALLEFAQKLAAGMKRGAVYQNYLLHQTILEKDKDGPFVMDLSYLELASLDELAKLDPSWRVVYEKSLAVLLEGMRPNGFFYDKYDVSERRYFDDEKNLINQLIVAINLTERGFSVTKFIDFLESEWEKHGKIYGRYDPDTREALVDYESVAVYGLLARLALLNDKVNFAKALAKRMGEFADEGSHSIWTGSLAGAGGHSFDHLEALLTLIAETKKRRLSGE